MAKHLHKLLRKLGFGHLSNKPKQSLTIDCHFLAREKLVMIPTIAIVGVEEVKPSDRGEELENVAETSLGKNFPTEVRGGAKALEEKKWG